MRNSDSSASFPLKALHLSTESLQRTKQLSVQSDFVISLCTMSHLKSKGIYKDGRFLKNPAIALEEERAKTENYKEPDLTRSKIVEFFKGRTVFLTGATGFLGKVVLEKLLRSCPDLEKIIIICREKKGKDMNTRMDAVFEDPLYARLLKVDPKFRQTVTILAGDISKPGMGISEEDRNLITSKASVIIHGAATVRFDEPLKTALQINLMGTQEMLQLASECSNLVSLLYVSTAFSNCPHRTIEEKFYPVPIEPNELINLMNTKTTEEMEEMKPSLLGKWPNTYSFSKALAETLINKAAGSLPLAIVRPSIIISTYNEPVRGWIDNLNGPAGTGLGHGLGIIHVHHLDGNNIAEIIPVDIVASAIIAVVYKQSITKFDEVPIYNCVSSPQSPINWKDFTILHENYGRQIPSVKRVWYSWIIYIKYNFLYQLMVLMLHIIPALIFDGAAIVMGKKPRLLKLYKYIYKFGAVINYFLMNRWTFSNKNMQSLWDETSPEDRIVFPFDAGQISWDYYAEMYTMGLRIYLLKDDPSTIPQGKIIMNRYWILDMILRVVVLFGLLRLVYGLLTMVF